jgi:hypothetical protein
LIGLYFVDDMIRFPLKKSEKYQHQFSVLRSIRPPPQSFGNASLYPSDHHGNDGACRSCSRIAATLSEEHGPCVPQVCAFDYYHTILLPITLAVAGVVKQQQRGTERSALDEKVAATIRPEDEEDTQSVRDIIFPQPFENMPATDEYK